MRAGCYFVKANVSSAWFLKRVPAGMTYPPGNGSLAVLAISTLSTRRLLSDSLSTASVVGLFCWYVIEINQECFS